MGQLERLPTRDAVAPARKALQVQSLGLDQCAGLSAFIQFHIEMDGSMPLAKAHEISDQVELAVREAVPDCEVLIHEDREGAETIPQFLRA